MPARDDRQLGALCRWLLAPVRLGYLWGEERPTERGFDFIEAGGGPLSSGERVMLLGADALWRCPFRVGLDLGEVLGCLDDANLQALLAAIDAFSRGPEAIDELLSRGP